MSKETSFDRWFYETDWEYDPHKPVNTFDAEFSSFHSWLETQIKNAYYAGYERGKEVEAALQEISDLVQESKK